MRISLGPSAKQSLCLSGNSSLDGMLGSTQKSKLFHCLIIVIHHQMIELQIDQLSRISKNFANIFVNYYKFKIRIKLKNLNYLRDYVEAFSSP
jgi:hypothetical protein